MTQTIDLGAFTEAATHILETKHTRNFYERIYTDYKWKRGDLYLLKADGLKCTHCKFPIRLFIIRDKIVRDNRVDVEISDRVFKSYHIRCYDRVVFGFIRHSTILRLNRLRKKYLSI